MKDANLIQNSHLAAVRAAFLVVYSMRERLQNARMKIENPGPGRNAYVSTDTSFAKITLPANARPSVQVRRAKNQILSERRNWTDRNTNKAIDRLIAMSFNGLNANAKRDFRKAFARFKLHMHTTHD